MRLSLRLMDLGKSALSGRINQAIHKDKAVVVNTVDITEIKRKTAYCRCWKSSKFPFCDGTHKKHNQETGDNVGPLIMERPGA